MDILQYIFSMWAFIYVPALLPQEFSHNCSKIATYTARWPFTYFFIPVKHFSRLVYLYLPRMSPVDCGDKSSYFCGNVNIKISKVFILRKETVRLHFLFVLLT